jgi:hypothetical protein
MAQNKTRPTRQKVSEFIAGIEDTQKRADCRELMKIMRAVTVRRALKLVSSRIWLDISGLNPQSGMRVLCLG